MRNVNPVILDDNADINDPFQVVEAILDLSRHVYALNYVGKTKAAARVHSDINELADFLDEVSSDKEARDIFQDCTGTDWRGIKKMLKYVRNIQDGDLKCVTMVADGLMGMMAAGMVGDEVIVEEWVGEPTFWHLREAD